MAGAHFKDTDRLLLSILLAFIFHICFFVVIQFIIKQIPPREEYGGPLVVEIMDSSNQLAQIDETIISDQPEEPVVEPPVSDQPVVEEPIVEEPVIEEPPVPVEDKNAVVINQPKIELTKAPEPVKKTVQVATAKKSVATPKITQQRTARITAVITREPKPEPTVTDEPSSISDDILKNLNKVISSDKPQETSKSTAVRTSSPGSKTSAIKNTGNAESGTGGTTHLIKWDVADEQRIIELQPEPILPDLTKSDTPLLTVELSFAITPQGFLTDIRIKRGCGYTEVDNAVKIALTKWKFRPVSVDKSVSGTITFEIKTR